MKFRNTWFDLTTFLGSVLMLGWAAVKVRDYFRGIGQSLSETIFTVTVFLLIAVLFLKMSLFLGSFQERVRQYRRKIGMQSTHHDSDRKMENKKMKD